MEIQELRAGMHKAVDALIDGKVKAGLPIELSPEVQKLVDAGVLKVASAKVPEAIAGQINDAAEFLKSGIIVCRVADRQSRPDDEKSRFENIEGINADVAKAVMLKKLDGVDATKYKLFEYANGRMKASAFDPNAGKWVGIGEKSGGYNNPGSLAWKIKTIISGKDVIDAS